MRKFVLIINGENFMMKEETDEGDKIRNFGFSTTRCVEAESPSQAEDAAMDLIREELKDAVLNERSNSPMMYVDELTEVDSFGDRLVPGKGFSFFEEEAK